MKNKLNEGARFLVAVVLVLLLGGACGKATSSSSGSNTNWLTACKTSDDCRAGAECWCNVCAQPCGNDVACAEPGASCEASTARGCGESAPSSTICVASCKVSADCAVFGAGSSCVNSACIVAGEEEPAPVGSAGASSGPPEMGEIGAVAIGGTQRCLISGEALYCWGGNVHGEAGGQPSVDVQAVHLLPEVPDPVELAVSANHTCALTRGGDVYCWGYNQSGEIGSESAPERTCPDYVLDRPGFYPCQPTPTRVAAVSGARHIAVYEGRSCAVLADDSVTCWGDTADISAWVAGARAPEGLALGPSGACAVTPEGKLSCSNEALETNALRNLKGLALSSDFMTERFGCAVGVAGDVHCWGDNAHGQLGQAGATGVLTNPFNDAVQVVATSNNACALASDGGVWCWGVNTYGESGSAPLASPNCGTENCEPTPQRVQNLPKAVRLAAGAQITCAVTTDAALWCWGIESARTAGTPRRIPGPWEGGEAACVTSSVGAREALEQVFITSNTTYCETDRDCTRVALDLPCLHTCESVSATKTDAPKLEAAFAEVARTYCDGAPTSCSDHPVECATTSDRDLCFDNICTRVNLDRSGCTDVCSCAAERAGGERPAAFGGAHPQGECAGPDLWVVVSSGCPACGSGGAWLIVGNRGDAAFSGSATLSFEAEAPEQSAALPPARSLDLSLAPGAQTRAFYVESHGEVLARPRITGAGDCQPLNDASSEVNFPAALACP